MSDLDVLWGAQELEHPNVALPLGICIVSPSSGYLVTQHSVAGSLQTWLDCHASGSETTLRLRILHQVLSAVAHMHAHKTPVGPLQAESVLLDHEWNALVSPDVSQVCGREGQSLDTPPRFDAARDLRDYARLCALVMTGVPDVSAALSKPQAWKHLDSLPVPGLSSNLRRLVHSASVAGPSASQLLAYFTKAMVRHTGWTSVDCRRGWVTVSSRF